MNFLHTLNFQLSKRGQCRHQMTQNQTVLLLFFKGNWSQNNGSLSLAETSGFCYENCKNVSSTKTNFLVSSFWIFNFRLFWVVEIKIYTVQRYITHSKEFPGNQGKHQNFHPSILSYKFWLIFMGMKQKFFFFFEKKNTKWPTQKKFIFQNRQFSKFFRENFTDLSLG